MSQPRVSVWGEEGQPSGSFTPTAAGSRPPSLSEPPHPSCRLFLATHRLPPSFAEESCSYFRHFNPGESSEIFEVTTQKGEPVDGSGRLGRTDCRHTLLSQKIIWHKSLDLPALDEKSKRAVSPSALRLQASRASIHQGWRGL